MCVTLRNNPVLELRSVTLVLALVDSTGTATQSHASTVVQPQRTGIEFSPQPTCSTSYARPSVESTNAVTHARVPMEQARQRIHFGHCSPFLGMHLVAGLTVKMLRADLNRYIINAHRHICKHVILSNQNHEVTTPRDLQIRSWNPSGS